MIFPACALTKLRFLLFINVWDDRKHHVSTRLISLIEKSYDVGRVKGEEAWGGSGSVNYTLDVSLCKIVKDCR